MSRHLKTPAFVVVLVACILAGAVSSAEAQNCPAAIPNDSSGDDTAIQNCIDSNTVTYLAPGTYILEFGLRIYASGRTLTSSDPSNRARLLAHSNLNGEMIRADAANWEISYIIFDGNKNNRTASCSYPLGHNIIANGSGFVVRFVDSVEARCGSALEVNFGSGYEIYNNTLAHNGFSIDERTNEYADGMTIHSCTNAVIRNNQFSENTDIGIVINESSNCQVRFNSIANYGKYAFAGMHISANTVGNHSGSTFSNNIINSGFNLMGFGLIVGAETWHTSRRTANVGTVQDNGISGAVINLGVDGVDGGTVTGNTMSSAQGTRGYAFCNGLPALDFAADHNGPGLSLQAGWTTRTCH